MININKVIELELGGVDRRDYPDFCDVYAVSGLYPNTKGGGYRDLTDDELDYINNECMDYLNEKAHESLYN